MVELRQTYDAYGDPNPLCGINTTYNAKRKCLLEFEATADMEPPILVHYELSNFHQNHKLYYQSKDRYQLLGAAPAQQTKLEATQCSILNKLGDVWLNPCGLIANTFFNDIFTIQSGNDANGNPLELVEKGIAWLSDLEYKYAQPDAFQKEQCEDPDPVNGTCNPDCCLVEGRTDTISGQTNLPWSCADQGPAISPEDGLCYRYHYPDEDITQYLYETYPDVINPLEGVTNEHFVVWMRIATLPTFRKLYGYFDEPIAKGTIFTIEVEANYVVQSFKGSKSLIISTSTSLGGKNPILGEALIAVGAFCLLVGVIFTLKHWLLPRKLADRKYLHFKED